MIETRYPVMNAIGPVVARCRGLPVFISGRDQTVFRFPVISDDNAQGRVLFRRLSERDVQAPVTLFVTRRHSSDGHRINRHLAEIQIKRGDWLFQKEDIDLRCGVRNLRQLIVESERHVVVERSPGVGNTLAPFGPSQRDS